MNKTLVSLRQEILQEDYDAAVDGLAHVSTWELTRDPNMTDTHTLEVISSYLIAVGFAVDGPIDKVEERFEVGLIKAGYDQQAAQRTAVMMTSETMFRKAFSLYNLTEDAPLFGLRIREQNRREADIPRFIYSAIKLSKQ
ncbi:hypothetical protein H0X10_02205 [Candidatus Saccharibacteria bacterium]|nr:hypothetical protein [Candidatus Saccharibacteria bacterium]